MTSDESVPNEPAVPNEPRVPSQTTRPRVPRPSRRSAVEPFHVMEVLRAANEREAAGHHVLHLEVGQPSTGAPSAVVSRATEALHADVLGYTPALGVPDLRSAIADWYRTRHDLSVSPERVMVTSGASGSCLLAFLAMFDVGDRVAVFEPGYPCYRNDLVALGVEVVGIPLDAETDFRPTPAHLEASGRLDGVVLASPSNPTGTMLGRKELWELLDWAAANNVQVIVDEIYHGIDYDQHGVPASALEWVARTGASNVVVFNSFSKYFSMTGWRLGWIVAPGHLMEPLERLGQNLVIAASTLSQIAAVAAFDSVEECEANVERYARNREVLTAGLRAAGLTDFAPPDGAFYIWVDVSGLLDTRLTTSTELCQHWLETIDVAATPGIDFDPRRGDRFVRFSYSGATDDMELAMERLGAWTRNRDMR